MLTVCTFAGPLFTIGTVGVTFYDDIHLGIIIYVIHFISVILSGLLLKRFMVDKDPDSQVQNAFSGNIFYDSMIKAITNMFIVGGYVVIFSVISDILFSFDFVNRLLFSVAGKVNCDYTLLRGIFCGILEMTTGLNFVAKSIVNIKIRLIISSVIISFGGFSVMLQSLSLFPCRKKIFILYKLFVTLITVCVSVIIMSFI